MTVPFKLLELTIFSAQDLPPVSKMLRTFAVAYVHPDHKLTTRVDHQGHKNPTWNYKVVFHVDDRFLRHESSAVIFEIYNLAWLRDLPIGTTRLVINNLSPPLERNPSFRRVAIQIRQPSGHLRGTLNLGIQLIDNVVPGCEVSVFSMRTSEKTEDEYQAQDQSQELNGYISEGDLGDQEKSSSGAAVSSKNDNFASSRESRITGGLEPEPGRKNVITPATSLFSVMRPLPSEVANDMRRGLYTAEWNEYGSSIFENWTDKSDDHVTKSESVNWEMQNEIPLNNNDRNVPAGSHPTKRTDKNKKKKKKNGLLSCFANAYGFQFSFICGSKTMKKKKIRNVKPNVHVMTLPKENLRRFYALE